MQPLPRAMVSGLAVNDIVHLVAELLDDAAAYSDPETQVELSARFGDEGGLVVEIRDAGTGLRQAAIDRYQSTVGNAGRNRCLGVTPYGPLCRRPTGQPARNLCPAAASSDGSGVTVTVAIRKS